MCAKKGLSPENLVRALAQEEPVGEGQRELVHVLLRVPESAVGATGGFTHEFRRDALIGLDGESIASLEMRYGVDYKREAHLAIDRLADAITYTTCIGYKTAHLKFGRDFVDKVLPSGYKSFVFDVLGLTLSARQCGAIYKIDVTLHISCLEATYGYSMMALLWHEVLSRVITCYEGSETIHAGDIYFQTGVVYVDSDRFPYLRGKFFELLERNKKSYENQQKLF